MFSFKTDHTHSVVQYVQTNSTQWVLIICIYSKYLDRYRNRTEEVGYLQYEKKHVK